MEKTAIRQLIDFIDEEILLNHQYNKSPRLREGAMIVKIKAQELETVNEQQIKDAYNQCSNDTGVFFSNGDSFKDGENYFTQTFEK